LIFGIGTDIIDIKRVERSVSNDNGFKEKVFTQHEIDYCEPLKSKYQNYAARYAAKEAFFKAIGTGWRGGLKFTEIEIVNDKLGKPEILLYGKAKEFAQENGFEKIHVSLTHLKEYANSIVIIETK